MMKNSWENKLSIWVGGWSWIANCCCRVLCFVLVLSYASNHMLPAYTQTNPTVTFTVDASISSGHRIPSTLFGLFFEVKIDFDPILVLREFSSIFFSFFTIFIIHVCAERVWDLEFVSFFFCMTTQTKAHLNSGSAFQIMLLCSVQTLLVYWSSSLSLSVFRYVNNWQFCRRLIMRVLVVFGQSLCRTEVVLCNSFGFF